MSDTTRAKRPARMLYQALDIDLACEALMLQLKGIRLWSRAHSDGFATARHQRHLRLLLRRLQHEQEVAQRMVDRNLQELDRLDTEARRLR